MARRDDATLLEWAAHENRVLITHDIKTIPDFARVRIETSRRMPGVIIVKRRISLAQAIEELCMVIELGRAEDLENQLLYIPL